MFVSRVLFNSANKCCLFSPPTPLYVIMNLPTSFHELCPHHIAVLLLISDYGLSGEELGRIEKGSIFRYLLNETQSAPTVVPLHQLEKDLKSLPAGDAVWNRLYSTLKLCRYPDDLLNHLAELEGSNIIEKLNTSKFSFF